ncbi:hypothetical protein ES692_06085 [Psychroserpens burtonensis]|uniref:Uncharacterized protein n=1 Tax=Psychroserpens burtonensis TaxID=49278 RepID=A0A5C7B8G7_9FLAO|nr:hypothetical protein [Psychroserpens burtonensis]TXE18610.1 hypothetical protein ES692_06085 [Psychroserpens burtonensis]
MNTTIKFRFFIFGIIAVITFLLCFNLFKRAEKPSKADQQIISSILQEPDGHWYIYETVKSHDNKCDHNAH